MRFRFPDAHQSSLNVDLRPVLFQIIQYNEDDYFEYHLNSLSELRLFLAESSSSTLDYCTWINIDGIHRRDILADFSSQFDIHQLILEDISTINERMKLDLIADGSSIYLLMKMIYVHPEFDQVRYEQISFLFQENHFLITFQEAKIPSFDFFQPIKYRLKNNRGKIRLLKLDYLFYSLIETLIENYIIVLDQIGGKIDLVDKLLMYTNDLNIETLKLIYHMKHDMLSFRILCKPLREILIKLQKAQDRISMVTQNVHSRRQYRRKKRPKRILLSGNYFFDPNSDAEERSSRLLNEYIFIYLKNLNDQIIQLQDRIETYCDLLASLSSFYMIIQNAEMNKIMRFFTLVSITFIPMMFLIGLFSMNYHTAPPLLWHYGYGTVWAILGTYFLAMIGLFKWKNLL